nr:hypothetical protein [Tanacetum cinerariifolium]
SIGNGCAVGLVSLAKSDVTSANCSTAPDSQRHNILWGICWHEKMWCRWLLSMARASMTRDKKCEFRRLAEASPVSLPSVLLLLDRSQLIWGPKACYTCYTSSSPSSLLYLSRATLKRAVDVTRLRFHYLPYSCDLRVTRLPLLTFDAFCERFHIPEEGHPVLPDRGRTMHERPIGKIGLYTRYFRINISQSSVIGAAKVSYFEILCHVYGITPTVGLFRCFYVNSKKNGWMSFIKRSDKSPVCYTKPLYSLKNWNDHFLWVDDFAYPTRFSWHTAKNVTRDPAQVAADFYAQDYATLVAHPSPFRKFLEEFLCLVGLSLHYTLDEETYPLFLDRNEE